MCQRSLVVDAGPEGVAYHIAEAAHIVAEKPGGPRGATDRPADVDGIDNLVLLCPSDHRAIDKGDGPRLWPRRKLLKLKRDHESWTAVLAARPPAPETRSRGMRETRPGDVVVVDGEPYRLCGGTTPARDVHDHAEGAYEFLDYDGGSVTWCQGHAYGEGGTEGHAWLRRSEADPGSGVLRSALADEAALLTDLPPLPSLPRLLGVEMTVEAVTLVTAMPTPVSIRDRFTAPPQPGELTLLFGALPSLCEALEELHDRGLSHRALSPGAILMPKPGMLRLRDLGLSTVPPKAGERADRHHAPEQAAGAVRPGPAADVHRLARILYELVTGRPAGRRDRHVAPSVLNSAVPAAGDAIFRDALAADPARRPGVRAFAAGLRAAILLPGGPTPPGRRWS